MALTLRDPGKCSTAAWAMVVCVQATNKTYTNEQKNAIKQLFEAHGMVLTGPPLIV